MLGGLWLYFVCLEVLDGLGSYFQTPWRFLRRLRSFSSQKTQMGPVTGQKKTNKKLETCLRRAGLLYFALAPKSTPRGYFWTKNNGIDAESARESENTTRTARKPLK